MKNLKLMYQYVLKKFVFLKSQSGFTMIELIVYMGLLSIFIVILTTIFTSSLDVQLESKSRSSLVQDGQFILARLSYDINRASAIVTPANLGDTSPPSPATPTLALTINGGTYTYSMTNGILYLNNGSGNQALNSYNTTIQSLSFQRLGNAGGKNTIKVAMTLQSVVLKNGTHETVDYATTLGIR